ncbi:Antiholin-like protein LrgA [uncultured Ruminococcus sp.]|uniref:CidA/LrgA family protein n=1 Tax=Massiliimalia timonensis TaxID=1987501 RepID=A0A8J6PC63_9FIRM|nr:CidA/LrgA family protein [Massiliimalia timonensis]MBC8611542.1 CidA/LrgA family protein [Massiliimalia timonensis]SCH01351.1 Antiholin-like protein LrgA [uncultured Clostridium sp.]SCH97264.1 Antiholin-like protein LrgA [uncultured Ruminococcus sp.]
MKLLLQIAVVFGVCLVGEVLEMLVPLPIPASVWSMVLLFLCLLCGALREEHIREKADFLLKNMAFFFIPAGVSIIEHYGVLKSVIVPFLIICFVTTIITFAATAGTVILVTRLMDRGKEHE